MPLSPPVKLTHWNATDQTICAKARVSIAKYTPDNCTAKNPNTTAPSIPSSGPSSSEAIIGRPASLARKATP